MNEAIRKNRELKVSEAPTCVLVDELRTRLGVQETVVGPYEHEEVSVDGPAIVLVVID